MWLALAGRSVANAVQLRVAAWIAVDADGIRRHRPGAPVVACAAAGQRHAQTRSLMLRVGHTLADVTSITLICVCS